MAKERGIDTCIINWNIIVSKSFRENYGEGNTGLWADGYTSPQIEKYTRETVTQVINRLTRLRNLMSRRNFLSGTDKLLAIFLRKSFRLDDKDSIKASRFTSEYSSNPLVPFNFFCNL